jgi:Secretory lipase
MYHGSKDEIIPYESAKATAEAWCANGGQVTFLTETGGAGHAGTSLSLSQHAVDWLDDRVTGAYLPSGCSAGTINAHGLIFKREGRQTDVITEFGRGDSIIISKMMEQVDTRAQINHF